MMVLFGRKKEEKKALACACSAAYSACETVEIASDEIRCDAHAGACRK